MLYEFRDLNNWIFEKQTATTLQQKLYWFCAIRNVFHNTFTAMRDQLDPTILDIQCPDSYIIPPLDPLSRLTYYLALDAFMSWVDPKFNMQCIIAKRKNSKELPRGIVLYNEERDLNGNPYVYIHYLVACEKGTKMGLGLSRSVLLEFPQNTQFYLEVHKINQKAIHLYEKLNFTVDDKPTITPDFNLDCAYLMGLKSTPKLLNSLQLSIETTGTPVIASAAWQSRFNFEKKIFI